MASIRPINEELYRLNQQPVVSEDMDDQNALAGFSVTSCVSRPPTPKWSRAISETSLPYISSHSCCRHHHRQSSATSSSSAAAAMGYSVVYYPATQAPTFTVTGAPVEPYYAPIVPPPHYPYYHRQSSYGSPGTIPRVSW